MHQLTGWLKKLPRHRGLIMGFEAMAGLAVVLALGLLMLGWRISNSPMSVMMFQSLISSTLNAEISNAKVRFSDAVVMWDDSGVQFRLVDLRLVGKDAKLIAGAPSAAVSLAMSSLFAGKLRVSRMILVEPVITLSRNRSGAFNLGFADKAGAAPDAGKTAETRPSKTKQPKEPKQTKESEAAPSAPQRTMPLWQALFTDRKLDLLALAGIGPESSLTHIGVRNASLALIDETSGQVWRASNVRLAFSRTATADTFFGSASFEVDKARSHLTLTASHNRKSRNVSVLARFRDLDPADFAPLVAELMLGKVSLPLSGSAALSISGDGRLLSASADIESGAGLIGLPGPGTKPILVDEASLSMKYDGLSDRLAISSVSFNSGPNQISLNGGLLPERDQAGNITGFTFDLLSQRMALALGGQPGAVQQPLLINRAAARGRLNIGPFHLRLDQLAIAAGKLTLNMKGQLSEADISPELYLEGYGRAIPVADLKRLWPRRVSPGTQEWIDNNITAGMVDNLKFRVDLTSGDIAAAAKGIPLPDNSITMDFDLRGMAFHYIRGLPQITNASGHGRWQGDKFTIKMNRARIKSPSGQIIKITSGQFQIPEIHKDTSRGHADGRIRVSLAGSTRGILEILDMEPLGYVRKMDLNPKHVGGTASGVLHVSLPLIRDLDLERVRVDADAKLKNTRIRQVIPDLDLSHGNADMHITNKGLVAKGKIRLNGVIANLAWHEDFVSTKRPSSRFELTGSLDDANRNALGVDLSDFLTGRTKVKLLATGRRGGISEATVKADLTGAVLKSDEIVWRKPAGRRASANFRLAFKKGGLIQLRKLIVKGKGVTLKGGLDFTNKGDLLKLNLTTVRLGPVTNLSLAGKRGKKGILHLKLSGKAFDARPLLTDLFSSGPSIIPANSAIGPGRHVKLKGKVKLIRGHNGVRLGRAVLELESIGDTLEAFSMTGQFRNGQPFRMKIARETSSLRKLTLIGQDAGEILKGADFYARIKGGTFSLRANMIEGGKGPDMTGVIRLAKFNIVNEPALSSLIGSARQKNGKPLADKNVPFKKFRVKFSRQNQVITFREGLITGPSIGATARGKLDNRRNTVLVAGTLVPAYGLNAALGKIPVLGRFLSGRKGEGLIGITFGINGPRDNPLITVNPVSALAPGFLRMLFEFQSGTEKKPPPPGAALKK